jgi:hypothetical protein
MSIDRYKYLLTKYVMIDACFSDMVIVGTFDSIGAVNTFMNTSDDYPKDTKFISCRQINEYEFGAKRYKIELTSIPYNPVNRVNELKGFFEEEPTIEDLEDRAETQPLFLDFKKKGYSIHTYPGHDSMSLQFWGWAIVLNEDGTWFWEDTSGG